MGEKESEVGREVMHSVRIDEDGGGPHEDRMYDMHTDGWIQIGEWLFPTKDNTQHSQVFYHLCLENHKRKYNYGRGIEILMNLHYCTLCNKAVPDGLKMVAMLLESL